MDSLVLCACGHALTMHGERGCSGDRAGGCRCPHDRRMALEAAVESVRTKPWRPPDEAGDRRSA